MVTLEIKNLEKCFGGIKAVDGLSFQVEESEILGLMGPNGSGKTTTFDLIMGFQSIDSGEIIFKKKSIHEISTHKRVRSGIGRTFQISRVFNELTALENLLVPYCELKGRDIFNHKKAIELLKFLDIYKLKDELASNLSYGQQKLIELGRVLITNPSTILLDEPAGGINPILIEKILEYIEKLRNEEGKSFIIVEHNLKALEDISDRIIVLDHGRKIAEGTMENLRKNKEVINAYLGVI